MQIVEKNPKSLVNYYYSCQEIENYCHNQPGFNKCGKDEYGKGDRGKQHTEHRCRSLHAIEPQPGGKLVGEDESEQPAQPEHGYVEQCCKCREGCHKAENRRGGWLNGVIQEAVGDIEQDCTRDAGVGRFLSKIKMWG